MFLFGILIILGALCLLIGTIVFIIGGFRESAAWGLILLFLPFLGALAGFFLGLTQTSWWWIVNLVLQLPWLVFLFMCWEKAKPGFLLMVAGIIFYAAAFFSLPTEIKPALEAAIVARTGQPVPAVLADWLGSKPGALGAKVSTPAAGAAAAKPGVPPANPVAAPAALPGSPAVAVAPPNNSANLETEAQVMAALAELHERAKPLIARKESLKNSGDQAAIFALAEDIKVFNERLKVVTTRQAELNQAKTGVAAPAGPAAPAPSAVSTATPPAGPVIPATVVIPASTPGPSPAPKKK